MFKYKEREKQIKRLILVEEQNTWHEKWEIRMMHHMSRKSKNFSNALMSEQRRISSN